METVNVQLGNVKSGKCAQAVCLAGGKLAPGPLRRWSRRRWSGAAAHAPSGRHARHRSRTRARRPASGPQSRAWRTASRRLVQMRGPHNSEPPGQASSAGEQSPRSALQPAWRARPSMTSERAQRLLATNENTATMAALQSQVDQNVIDIVRLTADLAGLLAGK